MEFTGKYRTVYSTLLNEAVDVLEYSSKDRFPYCQCSRCGRPIVKKMYVVQSKATGVEMMYLGQECIKHLS